MIQNIHPVLKSPVGLGVRMPRTRHQRGRVEEVGKRIRKWRGHYYIYAVGTDGKERRRHRNVLLGLKSKLKKWEAQEKLQRIIEKESADGTVRADADITFGWFWENRYLPMREAKLKGSSMEGLRFIGTHLLPEFGRKSLVKITRFECDAYLNRLGKEGYSSSLIHKAKTYLKAMLDEAVEQDFIGKNPARKLETPRVHQAVKRYLSEQDVQKLVLGLKGRDHLMLRMLLLCGLRPGEIFALRWNDWQGDRLFIDESVWEGEIDTPKTATSIAFVSVPDSLQGELEMWRVQCGSASPDDLIFPSERGTPIARRNWLNRNLKPAAQRAGIHGMTYQVLRRTFATVIQKCGTVKDAQAQLRHASAVLTVGTYMQAMPDSQKAAVEALDELFWPRPKGRVQ